MPLNQCSFIGNLGKDVELRYTSGGDAVASFSLAASEKWKDKNTGQQQEKTEWINIAVFGKVAEHCGKYLHKGSKVFVQGKFVTRKFQDKETGQDRYSTSIQVSGFDGKIQFLDPNPNAGGRNNPQQNQQQNNQGQQQSYQQNQAQTQQSAASGQQFEGDNLDQEIPF